MNTREIEIDGAVVYWSAGPTQRELLAHRLAVLGMADLAPDVRTDAACLKSALMDYCDEKSNRRRGKDKLLQARKRQSQNGFEVLDVQRGTDANDYRMDFAAKVMDGGYVTITSGTADVDRIRELFREHKATLTGASIGQLLVAVLERLGGTALRPSGGVYWIPGHTVPSWEAIATVVEECSVVKEANAVYCITHSFNERSVRAVKDAITAEVKAASAAVIDEIKENDLGPDALIRRQIVAASLRARVSQYEGIIGEAMTTLHDAVRLAEEAAASAFTIKAAEEQFAGIL